MGLCLTPRYAVCRGIFVVLWRVVTGYNPVERLLALERIVTGTNPVEHLPALVRLRGGKRFAFSSPQTPHLLQGPFP